MPTMSLKEFIRLNRGSIDQAILRACPNVPRLNDDDRRQWVLNDEGLYLWARRAGVKV